MTGREGHGHGNGQLEVKLGSLNRLTAAETQPGLAAAELRLQVGGAAVQPSKSGLADSDHDGAPGHRARRDSLRPL